MRQSAISIFPVQRIINKSDLIKKIFEHLTKNKESIQKADDG